MFHTFWFSMYFCSLRKDYVLLTKIVFIIVKRRCRSIHLEKFFKTDALKNFTTFTENTCVGLRNWNIIKKRVQHRCFLMNIAKFLRAALLIEHLWWLLLEVVTFFSIFCCPCSTAFIIALFFKRERGGCVCKFQWPPPEGGGGGIWKIF